MCTHIEGFRVPKTGNFPEDPVIEYYGRKMKRREWHVVICASNTPVLEQGG